MSSVRGASPAEPLIAADLILMLLAAPGGPPDSSGSIRGITRLEKLLFLAEKETGVTKQTTESFAFRPYNYGPYSKEIYEAAELLEEANLVKEERLLAGKSLDEAEEYAAAISELEGVERCFILTEDGRAVAELLNQQYPDVADALADLKQRYENMTLRSLIRYVYKNYPEYAAASKIRDQVL